MLHIEQTMTGRYLKRHQCHIAVHGVSCQHNVTQRTYHIRIDKYTIPKLIYSKWFRFCHRRHHRRMDELRILFRQTAKRAM